MGSQNSVLPPANSLKETEFRELKKLPTVYQNISNGMCMQKHIVQIQNQNQFIEQKQLFIYRRTHQDKLVSAQYFSRCQSANVCSQAFNIIYYTQLPEKKRLLGVLCSLSLQSKIRLLINCLEGFQLLYHKYGGFSINEGQLYFYNEEQLRVWMSSDASQSRPAYCWKAERVMEQNMIRSIFKSFDQMFESLLSEQLKKLERGESEMINFSRIIKHMKKLHQGMIKISRKLKKIDEIRSKKTKQKNQMNQESLFSNDFSIPSFSNLLPIDTSPTIKLTHSDITKLKYQTQVSQNPDHQITKKNSELQGKSNQNKKRQSNNIKDQIGKSDDRHQTENSQGLMGRATTVKSIFVRNEISQRQIQRKIQVPD